MKIRKKLTLRYSGVTALIFTSILTLIFLFSKGIREREFFHDLKREAITKANLFLENRVDAETMQSIYLNNREFINEVEVAIYTSSEELIYHDAIEIDIVKETPKMLQQIKDKKSIDFYTAGYQAIGMIYNYKGQTYIVTAAAYDGYGYIKLWALSRILIFSFIFGIGILIIVGYYLSKSALSPVSKIVKEAKKISADSLSKRIPLQSKENQDELDELADSFNQMLDRLEKAFDAQQQFVSNVSHELRTPLAALTAELEITLLKEREKQEYIDSIKRALGDAYNTNKLAEGLLNLAKANYNRDKIKMGEVRLDEVLLDARNLVLKANPDYNVNLVFEQESDDEDLITIIGNEYLLKIAFINLIENNCKFSENNSSLIQISFWEKNTIILFSDNGRGIAPDEISHIFEPFYRGKESQGVRGFGIGMTLCYNIIKLHKGDIEVQSELEAGTTYTIKLAHL